MKAIVKQLVVRPLRYAARLVLQRPWLKKYVRDMVIRMPRLHAMLLRMMSQAPAPAQYKMSADQKELSANARRAHRALRQAIRTQRR